MAYLEDLVEKHDFDRIHLSFQTLDASKWKVNGIYKVKVILRQTGMDENGADFEVVDATPDNSSSSYLSTDEGGLKRR